MLDFEFRREVMKMAIFGEGTNRPDCCRNDRSQLIFELLDEKASQNECNRRGLIDSDQFFHALN